MAFPDSISSLYKAHFGAIPTSINMLAGSGSNRVYYLVGGEADAPAHVVGTIGTDPVENRAFIALARHFKIMGLPVPTVFCESKDGMTYLQEYIGDKSLFDCIATGRRSGEFTEGELRLIEKSIRLLPHFQIEGARGLDFGNVCMEAAMNGTMIRNDLNYFKYCFLKSSGLEFSEKKLDSELDLLASVIEKASKDATYFMIRDFQSRNIMLHNDQPYLIDFQGGRKGPAGYDVASFLWQAKARFTDEIKREMISAYVDEARQTDKDFSGEQFCESLPYFVLFRMLQTLGAYGFRGWTERKPHFLQSIPDGVKGLAGIFEFDILPSFKNISKDFPYLNVLANDLLASPKVLDISSLVSLPDFNGLTLTVTSFSYKRGVPYDLSGNGGGFVFDCRGIHNPGRYDEYKPLTGLDEPVIRFIEENGEIYPFLRECEALVDSSVKRYLERGFNSLSVAFGCTGGRHRSVYSAQALGCYFAERYPEIRVVITHRERRILKVLN